MSMEILGDNWKLIVEKVVKPLWYSEYASMYKSKRLDYAAFESLAGYELTKAFANYDEQEANALTFATKVMKRKPKTELRDEGRQKRAAISTAVSVHDKISEDSEKTFEDLVNDVQATKNDNSMEFSEMLKAIQKLLKPKEIRILNLACSGLTNADIANSLGVDLSYVVGVRNKIKSLSAVRRIGRIYGYLGGNENEV